jgi:hypothetical protein
MQESGMTDQPPIPGDVTNVNLTKMLDNLWERGSVADQALYSEIVDALSASTFLAQEMDSAVGSGLNDIMVGIGNDQDADNGVILVGPDATNTFVNRADPGYTTSNTPFASIALFAHETQHCVDLFSGTGFDPIVAGENLYLAVKSSPTSSAAIVSALQGYVKIRLADEARAFIEGWNIDNETLNSIPASQLTIPPRNTVAGADYTRYNFQNSQIVGYRSKYYITYTGNAVPENSQHLIALTDANVNLVSFNASTVKTSLLNGTCSYELSEYADGIDNVWVDLANAHQNPQFKMDFAVAATSYSAGFSFTATQLAQYYAGKKANLNNGDRPFTITDGSNNTYVFSTLGDKTEVVTKNASGAVTADQTVDAAGHVVNVPITIAGGSQVDQIDLYSTPDIATASPDFHAAIALASDVAPQLDETSDFNASVSSSSQDVIFSDGSQSGTLTMVPSP